MRKPIIHLYSICWNEEDMLNFFFDHYDNVVDHYFIYDDESTDSTIQMLWEHRKVTHRKLPKAENASYALAAQNMHNNFWKQSIGIADWVIISAIDEFLYHPDLLAYIAKCDQQGVTAMPAIGFQMISDEFPAQGSRMVDTIKTGAFWKQMNKLCVFKPAKITATNFAVGRHLGAPVGIVNYPKRDELRNLHYKYLDFEKTYQRHQQLNAKMNPEDIERKFGHRYKWSKEKLAIDWKYFLDRAYSNVFDPNVLNNLIEQGFENHWWR